MAAGREAENANPVGTDMKIGGVCANESEGSLGIFKSSV